MSILPKNHFKNSVLNQENNYHKPNKQISIDVLNSLEYDLIFHMYEKDIAERIRSDSRLTLKNTRKRNKQKSR